MDDTLLIHFNPAQQQVSWTLVNTAGELTCKVQQGDLAELTPLASKHHSVILLDNILLHINSVQLPTQNRQKLLRAIPYALEEQLADDVDEFHFVAAKSEGINTAVAGIRSDTLQEILATLAQHNIRPDAIIPDALCLPADAQQWSILIHDENTDIQLSKFNGAEYDRDLAALVIESNLKNETLPRPGKILLFRLENENVDDILAVIPDDIELVQLQYNQHPLVVYCGQYKNALPLNLLQGDFKLKSKNATQWKRWRLPAALAAVWLVLNLSVTTFQYQSLSSKNTDMQAQIIRLYKEAFPESRRIVNPRVQMEQKLEELKSGTSGSSDSLLTILSYAAAALAKDKNINLQSIDYRSNRVDINLTSTSLNAIQELNNKLNQSGKLKSEITSSASDKNEVKGSLRIQRAGA